MRITTKGRYAIRAVLRLANINSDKPVSIRELSECEDISAEFLEQIFFRLRKSGIISSVRGPGGGFKLEKSPSEITILDLFTAVEEGFHLTPCIPDNGYFCDRETFCSVNNLWLNAYEYVKQYFDSITLDDIINNRLPQIDTPKKQGDDAVIYS